MNGSSMTTAAIISLSEELEDISSVFYAQWLSGGPSTSRRF